MKYTMSYIPGIFVVYGPWKSQSGMSVEGKSCRYYASKKDNGGYEQHCKKFPIGIGKRKDAHLGLDKSYNTDSEDANIKKGCNSNGTEFFYGGCRAGEQSSIPVQNDDCCQKAGKGQ